MTPPDPLWVRWGQGGLGGVRWGQVGPGGVRLGQAGSSGATWGQVRPDRARGQRGSFSITRGGHGVRWVRRGVYMKMGAHNTPFIGFMELHRVHGFYAKI